MKTQDRCLEAERRLEMNNIVREIQQELAKVEKRRGTRYPKELQERVVQLVRNLQAQGHSMVAINTLLGMTGDTLARWTRNSSTEHVPVEVTSDSRMSSPGGELSLISPSGWRVTGLTLEQVFRTVQELRC
jgi:DNA invertase Pin-like site-specific DNA recombinase